jgi:hypothetical protein
MPWSSENEAISYPSIVMENRLAVIASVGFGFVIGSLLACVRAGLNRS